VRDGLIPNMFPEGETGASIIPPTLRCGFSTPSTAMCGFQRPHDAKAGAAKLMEIIECHRNVNALGIGMDPEGLVAAPGAAGLSANLDGRQGGRLGSDREAGQSG